MLYCRTYETETIVIHPNDNPDESHYIELEMGCNEPTFSVTCCCYEDWRWDFVYSKNVYELIKYYIMDCIRGCENMDELVDTLDAIFEENFMDMVYDYDDDCDGDCANCDRCED